MEHLRGEPPLTIDDIDIMHPIDGHIHRFEPEFMRPLNIKNKKNQMEMLAYESEKGNKTLKKTPGGITDCISPLNLQIRSSKFAPSSRTTTPKTRSISSRRFLRTCGNSSKESTRQHCNSCKDDSNKRFFNLKMGLLNFDYFVRFLVQDNL